MQVCPSCGKEIPDDALHCVHCGYEFSDKPDERWSNSPVTHNSREATGLGIGCILVLLACMFLYVIASRADVRALVIERISPSKSAWGNCLAYIKSKHGLNPAAAEAYSPQGVTALDPDHFRVSIHYAKKAVTYQCTLTRNADRSMSLQSLSAQPDSGAESSPH